MHPAALPVERLLADCIIRRMRRSGPGGQHRNKVETAVAIEHAPTSISAEASERRSAEENRKVALLRLRLRLAVEVRQPLVGDYQPSLLWRSRCRNGRIAVNPQHEDFPAILAEVLDVVSGCNNETKAAAAILGCTTSQLTKLLQLEPRAIAAVNLWRAREGLHKLK